MTAELAEPALETDETVGGNSVAALDRLVPPARSISRKSAFKCTNFFCAGSKHGGCINKYYITT